MRTLMNCDQVFDLLTRGPFPSDDDSDNDVSKHLAVCHECRELAEALRPAAEMLRESLCGTERFGLPSFNDQALVGDGGDHDIRVQQVMGRIHEIAQEKVARSQAPIQKGRNPKYTAFASYFSIALSLAAMLFVSCFLLWRPGVNSAIAAPTTPIERFQYLNGIGVECCLSRVSLESKGSAELPDAQETELEDCCTSCHAQGNQLKTDRPSITKRQTAVLAKSCFACHVAERS